MRPKVVIAAAEILLALCLMEFRDANAESPMAAPTQTSGSQVTVAEQTSSGAVMSAYEREQIRLEERKLELEIQKS